MESDINIEERLLTHGINSVEHRIITRDIKRLKEHIKTEEDWDKFYSIWESNKNYIFPYILSMFLNS
jgi:hypothetical protein